MNTCTSYNYFVYPFRSASSVAPLNVAIPYNSSNVAFLEHVVVRVTLASEANRGDIQLELTSPSGTNSVLLSYRSNDLGPELYPDWPFMSLHFWGENPFGDWTLTVRHSGRVPGFIFMSGLSVTFYGTAEIPEAIQRIPDECDAACARGCAAAGPEFCDACVNLRNAYTRECIDVCPDGYTLRNGYCYDSTLPQPQCTPNITGI